MGRFPAQRRHLLHPSIHDPSNNIHGHMEPWRRHKLDGERVHAPKALVCSGTGSSPVTWIRAHISSPEDVQYDAVFFFVSPAPAPARTVPPARRKRVGGDPTCTRGRTQVKCTCCDVIRVLFLSLGAKDEMNQHIQGPPYGPMPLQVVAAPGFRLPPSRVRGTHHHHHHHHLTFFLCRKWIMDRLRRS
jgi:hypothetical protein